MTMDVCIRDLLLAFTQSLRTSTGIYSRYSASTSDGDRAQIITKVTFHRPKTLQLKRVPLYPRKSVPRAKKLDQFCVLKYPLTTESAMKKIEDNNTLVFIVDVRATKKKVKDAVFKMYDIQTAKVNTLIRSERVCPASFRSCFTVTSALLFRLFMSCRHCLCRNFRQAGWSEEGIRSPHARLRCPRCCKQDWHHLSVILHLPWSSRSDRY